MPKSISQSAPLESIARYLQRVEGCDPVQAEREARQIVADFERMQRQGYISGWYFDEQGHLDLIPSDDVLGRLNER